MQTWLLAVGAATPVQAPDITRIILGAIPLWVKLIFLLPIAIELLDLLVDIYLEYRERKYLKNLGFSELNSLTPLEFEKFLKVLFSSLGYKTKLTPYTGDFGADLIIYKDGYKAVVQAKKYQGKVGVKAVQEVVAARDFYGANHCIVVTTSSFTKQAVLLARKNGVELIGRKKLRHLIEKAARNEESQVEEKITYPKSPASKAEPRKKEGKPIPVCKECGKALSQKVYEYCLKHRKEFLNELYCFDCQQKIRNINAEIERKIKSDTAKN